MDPWPPLAFTVLPLLSWGLCCVPLQESRPNSGDPIMSICSSTAHRDNCRPVYWAWSRCYTLTINLSLRCWVIRLPWDESSNRDVPLSSQMLCSGLSAALQQWHACGTCTVIRKQSIWQRLDWIVADAVCWLERNCSNVRLILSSYVTCTVEMAFY